MKTKIAMVPFILLVGLAALSAAGEPGQKPVADDVFKTGKARLVPLLAITDETLGGKTFFVWPRGFAADGQGLIYVSDTKENHSTVFDAAGTFLKTIGRKGQGPGEFQYLGEIEFSQGRLIASEGKKITILDREGGFIRAAKLEDRGMPRRMKALPDGRIVIETMITDYQSRGHDRETALDLYSADLAFVKTVYQRPIRQYKPITEPVATDLPIPFAAAVSWDLRPDGKIVIGYSESYEIEIHDPDKGRISVIRHACEPVEVTNEDKKIFFAGISYMTQDVPGAPPVLHRGAPDYQIKNTEFPKLKPAFTQMRCDAQGRIWVCLSGPAGEKDGPRHDVFDRNGRFIGRVRLLGGELPYRPLAWTGGWWMIRSAEEGEFSIVKYGLEAVK